LVGELGVKLVLQGVDLGVLSGEALVDGLLQAVDSVNYTVDSVVGLGKREQQQGSYNPEATAETTA